MNKNQKSEISSSQLNAAAAAAAAASLMHNQSNVAEMNFQNQQQQNLLASVLLFPSLFMPQTSHTAASSSQSLLDSFNLQSAATANQNHSFDQLVQQQLIASALTGNNNNTNNTNNLEASYLNNPAFLASLAGSLIQQQQQQQPQQPPKSQQQQQQLNEMTASNSVWAKLLCDMSSPLVGTDNNQSNILYQMQQLQHHPNTLMLANNGEVSLNPLPNKSNNRSNHFLESQSTK